MASKRNCLLALLGVKALNIATATTASIRLHLSVCLSGTMRFHPRYKSNAAILRAGGDAAPVELPGRVLVVDCEETSRKLLQVSAGLRKGALLRVTSTLFKLAGR